MQVKYSYNQATPGAQKTQTVKSPIQTVLAGGPKTYTPAAPAATPAQSVNPLTYSNLAKSAPATGAFKPPTTVPAPTAGGAPVNVDYASDPVLQQIQNNQTGQLASAAGTANDQIKQALIGFGDPTLARQATFFTADPGNTTVGDEQTAQAASANPTSTVAQLLQAHNDRTNQLNNNLNASNLYYSSTRGNELGNEDQTYLNDQSNAQSQLYGALTAAVQGLLGARSQSDSTLYQANTDAYNRALQIALSQAQNGAQSTAPTYPTGQGDYYQPGTYDSLGLTPQPITSGNVAPPTPLSTAAVHPLALGADPLGLNSTSNPLPTRVNGPINTVVNDLANALLSGALKPPASGYSQKSKANLH